MVTDTWQGVGFSLGPDMRWWAGDRWGVEASGDLTFAAVHNTNDPGARGLYLTQDGAFLALGLWLGGVVRF
jgi:hypothetical protein